MPEAGALNFAIGGNAVSKTGQSQTGRREFLKYGAAAAIGARCFSFGPRAEARMGEDEPTTHNMLIVGQKTIFLSHLPMFKIPGSASPHRFQVILQASFGDATSAYIKDREENKGVKIYTLNPEEFVLSHLYSPKGTPRLTQFKANIFRGHLEKSDNKLLVKGAAVKIERVIHFREFDPNLKKGPPQLEYILFGKEKELFLAHFITMPPDFDQVLSVEIDRSFTDEELSKETRVIFRRSNTISQRIKEKETTAGEFLIVSEGLKIRFRGKVKKDIVKVKAGTEYYLEEGELRVPAQFNTTSEEKKARFP